MNQQPIRLLLIEDDELDAIQFKRLVSQNAQVAIQVDHAMSMRDATELIDQNQYDILLLDLGLPDSLGHESIETLHMRSPATPIMVLTGDSRPEIGLEAIQAGVQDFLPKADLVGSRVIQSISHAIIRHGKLVKAKDEAIRDTLTGIANRRGCDDEFDRQLKLLRSEGVPFCVSIFDIDHFKKVNDIGGHALGDRIIQQVGQKLQATSRRTDYAARIGGEEFAVIFANTTVNELPALLEQYRLAVSLLHNIELKNGISVSIGATAVVPTDGVRLAFRRADAALYDAKNCGRNRYCLDASIESLPGVLANS